jgi:tRNA(Ile)-lysidine synthase
MRLQPEEIQRRIIVKAINWVSGSDYPPRMQAVTNVLNAIGKGQAGTVDGCHIRRIAARIWIFREFNVVATLSTSTKETWDGRWQATPDVPAVHAPELELRALGLEGLEQCTDWRATGLPHVVLQSTPAVWKGAELVAAPLAGQGQNWALEVAGGMDTFFAALLSH